MLKFFSYFQAIFLSPIYLSVYFPTPPKHLFLVSLVPRGIQLRKFKYPSWTFTRLESVDVKQTRYVDIAVPLLIPLFVLLSTSMIDATNANVGVERFIGEEEVAPGDELNVSLNISVSRDVRAILLTEKLPPGFNITASNPTPSSDHNITTGEVKWLFISHMWVSNATITYTVKVSVNIAEGVYHIEGYWRVVNSTGNIIPGETASTEVRVEKLRSTISISVSPSKVKVSEPITVTGSISPIRPNVNVTLAYVKPDSSVYKRNVTTSSDGEFMYTYNVDIDGSWSVAASWLGDSRYKGADSPRVSFAVEPLMGQWLTYAITATILIPVLSAVILLRKRKRSA